MRLDKAADRTVSVLGLLLFGTLTGVSLFTTVYFRTTYEEIPYQTGDILPLDPAGGGALLDACLSSLVGFRGKMYPGGGSGFRVHVGGGFPGGRLFDADHGLL